MDVKFDPTNFNKSFELNEQKKLREKNNIIVPEKGVQYDLPPHKQPIENVILDIRDTFFQVLNLVEDKQNPIPYIYSSKKRQFSFSLFLIIFGTLLLLLSSLMKSPNEK
jgi:hypothetical protein